MISEVFTTTSDREILILCCSLGSRAVVPRSGNIPVMRSGKHNGEDAVSLWPVALRLLAALVLRLLAMVTP